MHGTIYLDTLTDLAFDDENGVLYACGYTRGNFSYALDADPAPDFKPLDMVVLALDPSTQETIWLKTYTSGPLVDRDDYAYAITFDRNGVLHVGGTTRGTGEGVIDRVWLLRGGGEREALLAYFSANVVVSG